VCEVGSGLFGMSWSGDTILVGLGDQGIKRCAANGGPAEQFISVKDDETAHGPQMLPGGHALLYTLAARTGEDRWERAKIVAEELASHKRKLLIDGGTDARYLPSGHLIYAREGVLYAAAFNAERLEVGPPVRVLEGVQRGGIAGNPGVAGYIISNTGTLVYRPGPASTISQAWNLALTDREGEAQMLKLPPRPYEFPRFAPDGKRVAVETDDGKESVIWVIDDLMAASPPRRLTITGRNRFPIWNTDGERVAFQSDREGDLGIWWQRADGSGMAERLTKAESGEAHIPNSWSPFDRDTFVFSVRKDNKFSLWTYSLKSRTATAFGGVVSSGMPDGKLFT
jgi:dipeptidyl aminopeptidase/acylaminoacyl peptidase